MKPILQIAALLLGVGVVQSVLTQMWAPLGLFDGLMIAAGLLALRLPFGAAVTCGAAAGLIQDSLGGGLIGLHAFAKTVVTAALGSLGTFLLVRGQLAEALVIGLFTVAESLIVRMLLIFLGWPGAEPTTVVLARGAATGVLCGTLLVGGPQVLMVWQRWRSRPRRRLR